MIRGLVRRIAFLEAAVQAPDVPPKEGLHALLEWIKRHPSMEDDPDPGPDATRRPTGLARLLHEAKTFLEERNHG